MRRASLSAETVRRPAGDTVRPVPETARPALPEPSWGLVLATTIKLWVLRRWRIIAAVAVAAALAVTALAFSGAFSAAATPAARARPAGQPVTPRTSTRVPPHRRPRPRRGSPARSVATRSSRVIPPRAPRCRPRASVRAADAAEGRIAGPARRRPGDDLRRGAQPDAPGEIASFGSGDSRLYVQAASLPAQPPINRLCGPIWPRGSARARSSCGTSRSRSPPRTPWRSGRARSIRGCWRRLRRCPPSTPSPWPGSAMLRREQPSCTGK